MKIRLVDQTPGHTELTITTDTAFMGKLGELGQPLMHRKARNTMEEFARNLTELIQRSTG